MDRAGGSEFAIEVRIAAEHAIFAHIDVVFGAGIAGFSVRMISAVVHYISLFFELLSLIS
jgi:hypothetical protein